MSKGKPEQPGRGTKTQRLYREWLTADQETRALIENSLTNICVSACRNLCPPVDWHPLGSAARYKAWKSRWSARYRWCQEFVTRALYTVEHRDNALRQIPRTVPDECRYLARMCRLRLIDKIRASSRRSREDYLEFVQRDSKGRFLKRKRKTKEEPPPVKIIYSKARS